MRGEGGTERTETGQDGAVEKRTESSFWWRVVLSSADSLRCTFSKTWNVTVNPRGRSISPR